MGREIRRVPPDWVHPTYTAAEARQLLRANLAGKLKPLYDEVYEDAARAWLEETIAWSKGEHPDQQEDPTLAECYPFYWQWSGNPPDPDSYRHRRWTEAEATHFQVYETVSEGTPVSPVLDSREAVRDWAIAQGHSPEGAAAFALYLLCLLGYWEGLRAQRRHRRRHG